MEPNNYLLRFNNIFKETLDNDQINLSLSDTADDIEEWDSITHIQLIVEIESQFAIKFLSSELDKYMNVGELIEGVKSKIQ